jgi:hypothetical protein
VAKGIAEVPNRLRDKCGQAPANPTSLHRLVGQETYGDTAVTLERLKVSTDRGSKGSAEETCRFACLLASRCAGLQPGTQDTAPPLRQMSKSR